VWGETEGVNRYVQLAKVAGAGLPSDFRPPARLFPMWNEAAGREPPPESIWGDFVFVAWPSAFEGKENWPAPGSRIVKLNGDPFLVSALAIDRVLLVPPAEGKAKILDILTVLKADGWDFEMPDVTKWTVQPAADGLGGNSTPATAKGSKSRNRRGRKPDPAIDPKADKRVAEAWDSGQYKNYADLAHEFRCEAHEVRLAIDRHRKRECRKRR
jgi:hypothetical protein